MNPACRQAGRDGACGLVASHDGAHRSEGVSSAAAHFASHPSRIVRAAEMKRGSCPLTVDSF